MAAPAERRLSGAGKVLILFVVLTTFGIGASVAGAAALLYGAGTVAVDVVEPSGTDVSVHVPAGLVHLALMLVPDRLIDEIAAEVGHEVSRELQAALPAVRQAWSELEQAPDFTLVEVSSDDQQVTVRKRGHVLEVRVRDDHGLHVQVDVPVLTVRRALARL